MSEQTEYSAALQADGSCALLNAAAQALAVRHRSMAQAPDNGYLPRVLKSHLLGNERKYDDGNHANS